eukprot:9956735-Alexandrium_andersonii.AAC.1
MLSTATRLPRSANSWATTNMSSGRVRTCAFSSGWGRRCAPRRSRPTIRVRGAGSFSAGAPEARSAMAAAS